MLRTAERVPEATALQFNGEPTSYATLADQAACVAGGLDDLGVERGDAVAVMLPNVPEIVATVFGSLLAGCRIVPMNVLLQPNEIRYVLTDSRVKALVTHVSLLGQVEPALGELDEPPEVVVVGRDIEPPWLGFTEWTAAAEPTTDAPSLDDGSPLMTLYTSGTTGAPKGAVITNANLMAQLDMIDAAFPRLDDERFLCVLPLFHVFALNAILMPSVRRGSTVVLHTRFDAAATAKSLAEDGVTTFHGVPTMFFCLLEHTRDQQLEFPALRYCISGGAPMPVEVIREFEARFDVPIYECYGLTETTVGATAHRPGMPRKPGSVGVPYDGVELMISDPHGRPLPDQETGEIAVRGPTVTPGYFNRPEATAKAIRDGWFHTGDLGYRDADGYYFIVDRLKDMIIKGGYNIYPREIEEVLYERPEIAQAAVIGVHDAAKGEVVRAVIACKAGRTVSAAVLRTHLAARLAKYKLPQDYVFLDDLPKGPTGKILKRELRERWRQWTDDRTRAAEQS